MKYADAKVVFSEIPDEITLAVSISGCPGTCEGCHSPWLREDKGEELDRASLHKLIEDNPGISCICLMGGDQNTAYLITMFYWLKTRHPELKTAWYSGLDKPDDTSILKYLDYLKTGPYRKNLGPLNSPTTNQRFYKIIHTPVPSILLVDQTHLFWKKDSSEK